MLVPVDSRLRSAFGTLALFSGVALLLNIVGNVDLRLGLAATTAIMVAGASVLLRGATPAQRRRILVLGVVGAASGMVATVAYDLMKVIFAGLDPSFFDPFHAIHVFGGYLVGAGASEQWITIAGWSFHLLNGTAFGVGYVFLLARDGRTTLRRALVTGLAWGLFLESFQLALYPGWLNIASVNEFVASSLIGHVVYGTTLGAMSRALLRRGVPASGSGETAQRHDEQGGGHGG